MEIMGQWNGKYDALLCNPVIVRLPDPPDGSNVVLHKEMLGQV